MSFDTVRPLLKPTNNEPEALPEPIMDKTNYELRLAAVSKKTSPAAAAAEEAAAAAEAPSTSGSSDDVDVDDDGHHDDTEVPPPHVTKSLKRSGFAGCSTMESPGEFIDLDPYTALRYRVKSDGRKYIVSLRTDNWVTGGKEDLWQAFLFAPKDKWADIIIPMSRFLKTWRGRVMEHHYEMSASRVTGMGIAVAGGGGIEPEGPFRIEVASVIGLRLSKEELDMARRKAEAAWGAAAGFDLGLAAKGLRQSVDAGRIAEAEENRIAMERMKRKTKWKGEMLPSFLGGNGGKGEREREQEEAKERRSSSGDDGTIDDKRREE